MRDGLVTLCLCGDVMTGRGVDQILPRPGSHRLREAYVDDARAYVEMAERANGPIPRPVPYSWPWGSALQVLGAVDPDVSLFNLETSITRSDSFAPGKTVHYRMSPDNLPCLTAAGPAVCALANNHVLDFGADGLEETLDALRRGGVRTVGAGREVSEAARPAVLRVERDVRVAIVSFGMESSGVSSRWAATRDRAGVDFIPDLSDTTAASVLDRLCQARAADDIVVASIHWGSNWGYEVSSAQVRFAHKLIDGGVDIVHGHSSHHPRPIEVYRGKLVLYGCGDTIDDYEGIGGYERYRDDLRLLYFPSVEPGSGRLAGMWMAPIRARQMRLHHATPEDAEWLRRLLTRIGKPFGSRFDLDHAGRLVLRAGRDWTAQPCG